MGGMPDTLCGMAHRIRQSVPTLALALGLLAATLAAPKAYAQQTPGDSEPVGSQADRANRLIELAEEHQETDPAQAILHGTAANELLGDATKSDPFKRLALAMAIAHNKPPGSDTAIQWAERALIAARALEDARSQVTAIRIKAHAQTRLGDHAAALVTASSAEPIIERLDEPVIDVKFHHLLGLIHYRRASYHDALREFLRVVEIERSLDRPSQLARALNNVGVMFSRTKSPARAIEVFQQVAKLHRETGNRRAMPGVLLNIGSAYVRLDKLEEALTVSQEALALAEEFDDDVVIAEVSANMAYYLHRLSRPQEALTHSTRTIQLSRERGLRTILVRGLSNHGAVLAANDRDEDALKVLEEALVLATEMNANDVLNEIHDFFAEVYEKLGRHEPALRHFRKYQELREALLSKENQERVAELRVRYEAAEKDREISRLELSTLQNDAELRQQAITKNFAIVVSLVLLLSVGGVALGYRSQRRARINLEQALSELKVLRGLLPICSACKKIRDSQGRWSNVETYIVDHSEAEFTHGMCEPCVKEWYPDLSS